MTSDKTSGRSLRRRLGWTGVTLLLACGMLVSGGCGRKGPLKPLQEQPPRQHLSHRGVDACRG